MTKTVPRRVAARPNPCEWGDDELMSFEEAAALMWPAGPLTASSLRTAYRRGELEVVMLARKLLVDGKALRAMVEDARRRAAAPGRGDADRLAEAGDGERRTPLDPGKVLGNW